jgi:hypothetical protein
MKKEDIYKKINKEYREIDLRLLYVKLRESNFSSSVMVIN